MLIWVLALLCSTLVDSHGKLLLFGADLFELAHYFTSRCNWVDMLTVERFTNYINIGERIVTRH